MPRATLDPQSETIVQRRVGIRELLRGAERETLARWWCEMNVFEWPKGFPIPKPEGAVSDSEIMNNPDWVAAWQAINEAIPYPGALEYWRNTFLPARHKAP